MRSASLRTYVAVSIVHLTLLSSPALAQKKCPTPEAKRLYNEGELAAKKKDYATTAAKWEAAFAECPSSAIVFNLALVYRKLGKNQEALALYESYLEDTRNIDQKEKADVEARIEELKKTIAEEQENATKPPDGFKLVAQPPPAETPLPVAPVPVPEIEETEPPAWYADPWGWTATATGAVLVGVGAWFLIDAGDLDTQADATPGETERLKLRDDASSQRTIGTVLSVTGGAALVGGIILLAITPSPRTTEVTAGIHVTVGLGWLGLEGTF